MQGEAKHENPDAEERSLRESFRKQAGADFEIIEEVTGVHRLSGASVKVDFLCHPTSRICGMGFPAQWFVIETKHLDFARHESKRLYESFWQAVSYNQSEFTVNGSTVRPAFTAFVVNEQSTQRENLPFQAQKRRWQILMELGVYANIGFFRHEQGHWVLWFGQARLFHSLRGLSKVPRGLARYVGSRVLNRLMLGTNG